MPLTVTLHGGQTVLGKPGLCGTTSLQYSNRTQAEARAEKERQGGTACHVWRGLRVFYVVVEEAQ